MTTVLTELTAPGTTDVVRAFDAIGTDVFVADLSPTLTLPTSLSDTLTADWKALGWLTGTIGLESKVDSKKVRALQGGVIIFSKKSAPEQTFTCESPSTNALAAELAFGNAPTKSSANATEARYDISRNITRDNRKAVIVRLATGALLADGTPELEIWVLPEVSLSATMENAASEEHRSYKVTGDVLGAGAYVLTNLPAIVSGATVVTTTTP